MIHEVQTQWMGKMQFNALVNGHTVVMDTTERVGGEDLGPTPKPFILSSLSGCTGMDVVALLRKAQKNIRELNIRVEGEISKKAPIEYVAIHLIYDFKGPDESMQSAMEAVTDSQEKYCGVSHMLKKIMPVTWEVHFNGREIFSNKKSETNN